MKRLIILALAATTLQARAITPNRPDSVYLFSYATKPTAGLHLAYSFDKHHWSTVGDSVWAFVKSDFGTWGTEKKMFHPSLVFDGKEWFATWSLNNRSPQFATTRTTDLWLWKPQDYPYIRQEGSVLETVLEKAGNIFKVYYKSNDGNYYVSESSDFKNWESSKPVDEAVYQRVNRDATIRLNGTEVSGEIHHVPYCTVENLITKVGFAAWKEQRDNNANNPTQFNGNKSQHATLYTNLDDTKEISENLIGIFFEDINYSADGGLYAELVQNRDFEYNHLDRGEWNAQSFWTLKGEGTTWEIDTQQPIHANNPHYAVLTTKQPGAALQNNGFDGIVLKKGDKYDLSLFVKSLDGKGQKLNVKLLDGETVVAQTTLKAPIKEWQQLKTVLTASESTDHATLSIEPVEAGKLAIDFVSLFPQKTFKGRKNGLRADLAQTLADLHPRFIRFPGGCVSHGNGLENMYRWRTTVGPLWERKGQGNIWGYHQSKGLGFYEYFQFCEDIGAEPLPVLPAGVPCQNSSRGGDGQQGGLPMAKMEAYTQELLDLIEWANGDAKTSKLARLRAEAGHPKPFNLKLLGVGNEDLISDVFVERFNYIHKRIKDKHPEITIVGTVGPFFEGSDYEYGWQLARQENIDVVDEHYYVSPGWYVNHQDFYDKYDRQGTKVYLGEWASRGNTLENALAEALHVTNLERNADIVVMSSYAPLLAKHGHTQWNPGLIYFDNTSVHPTVNYYVQQLCGNNTGDRYAYSELDVAVVREGKDGKETTLRNERSVRTHLGNSVVVDSHSGDVIVKLVNLTPTETQTDITLDNLIGYQTKAQVNCISGTMRDKNVKPVTSTVDVAGTFNYTMPAHSFSVIRIRKK